MSDTLAAGEDILLDTQLAVLVVVSEMQVDPATFPPTETYTTDDAAILRSIAHSAKSLVTMPSIVAEASNLLGLKADRAKRLGRMAELMGGWPEHSCASRDAFAHERFTHFGAADSAILHALSSQPDLLLLTADWQLHVQALVEERQSINFNELR